MSIEDYTTIESKAKGMAIKVSLDIQGYAKEIANDVDEQLLHAVATRRGYVKERTCCLVDAYPDSGTCGECGAKLRPAIVRPGKAELNYCTVCDAKVVER